MGVRDGELSLKAALYSRSIIDWLVVWQEALQKIRQKNTMRREVTVELSSQGFWKTGIRSDVCQVTPANRGRKNTTLALTCTPTLQCTAREGHMQVHDTQKYNYL